jgi:hypothetical protein
MKDSQSPAQDEIVPVAEDEVTIPNKDVAILRYRSSENNPDLNQDALADQIEVVNDHLFMKYF